MSTSSYSVELHASHELLPSIKNAEARALLPKWGIWPISAQIIIRGYNAGYTNAIGRILLDEMDGLAMNIVPDSLETTDPFILPEVIAQRISLIRLNDKDVQEGDKFHLNVKNDSDEPRDVFTSDLIRQRGRVGTWPFHENIILFTLNHHHSIKLSAQVVRGIDDASFSRVSKSARIPLDQRPEISDEYEEPDDLPLVDGVTYISSSSMSNPRVYLLDVELQGTHDIAGVLKHACEIIIERCEKIRSATIIQEAGGSFAVRIPGETDTIGQLFSRVCVDLYPNISHVHAVVTDANELIIRIMSGTDRAQVIYTRVLDEIIKTAKLLSNQCAGLSRGRHK